MGCISSKTSRRNSLELTEVEVDETEKLIGLTKRQRLLHALINDLISCCFSHQVPTERFLEKSQQRDAGYRGQAFRTVRNRIICGLVQF